MAGARLSLIQTLAGELGLKGLAEFEANLVRIRQPPPRLLARLFEPTHLTPRQREIMVLLASGFSRQEIADELGISYETVKYQLRRVYLKLGVHNRVEAINAFLEEEA